MRLQGQTKRPRNIALYLVILFFFSTAIGQDQAKSQIEMAQQCSPELGYRDRTGEGAGANRSNALWKAYCAAVEHASIWRNEDVRMLKPLTMAADGTIDVVTATRYNVTSPLYGDTWVTVVPELQTICRQFTGDVAMQLRELLGLPPDHQIPNIVVMKVQSTDVFRPTPDPTPWTLCPCGNPASGTCSFDPEVQCGNSFPKDVSTSHVQWMANTTLSVRRMPGGFPWTHLGYTYNWKAGADPYGTSEYIVRKGAKVVVLNTVSLEEYCRP